MNMNLDDAFRELRAVNEPVPRPPRLPTPAEVDAAEARLGVAFPNDFRRYLLEASDITYGTLEPVTITQPESHTDLMAVAKEAVAFGVPRELIPLCESNSDFYCISSSGEVVFWSHDGPGAERWDSLADWIKEVWLYS